MVLTTNLVSYWKLDEASGNASDSVGVNTLTNNNAATFVAGKINNGAKLVNASNQFFSITDAAQVGLDLVGDLTYCLWTNFATLPTGNYGFVSKWLATTDKSFSFYYHNNLGVYSFIFVNTADGATVGSASINYTLPLSVWLYVSLVYTATLGQIEVFLNGLSIGTATGTLATSIYNGVADFEVGNTPATASIDGIIDEVGIWSRALTTTEVSELYNGGAGLAYPFILPPKDNAIMFGMNF